MMQKPEPKLTRAGTETTRRCNWCDPELEPNSENACKKPALAHVSWGAFGGRFSFFCETHIGPMTERVRYFKFHPVGPDCGMPGAIFYNDENVCRCDGSEVGLEVCGPLAMEAVNEERRED